MRLVADIFLLTGSLFVLLGALGLLRMPDVYNQHHGKPFNGDIISVQTM
jgi:monovalent cation/proton antiporter MnhG/PhaG subunit